MPVSEKMFETLDKVRKLTEEKLACLDELEYALLLQSIWEKHGTFNPKLKYSTTVEYTSTQRGHLVFQCENGEKQRYPVRVTHKITGYYGELNSIVDIYGNSEIPEQFTYWYLVKALKQPKSEVERARRIRADKDQKYGVLTSQPVYHGLADETPPGDAVRP